MSDTELDIELYGGMHDRAPIIETKIEGGDGESNGRGGRWEVSQEEASKGIRVERSVDTSVDERVVENRI